MTRSQANRLLDAVRYGGAQASEALITAALVETGDLGRCDALTSFAQRVELQSHELEEIAA